MMPIDLVLNRHGRSEGNEANDRSRADDHTAFTEEFLSRHSMEFRLTDEGIAQAHSAGACIRADPFLGGVTRDAFPIFDRHYTSAYPRALETAYYLDLPGATWYPEFYLRERDYGDMDIMSQEERRRRFPESLAARERQNLLWTPPNGESIATLCLRIDRILHTLHRECSEQRVILVCHGEVMWAFRLRLERLTLARYAELHRPKLPNGHVHPHDHIHNGQIIHYTRRDPFTGNLHQRYEWMRSICPWDLTRSSNEWTPIVRPKFTNEDLKAEFERYPRLVNNH